MIWPFGRRERTALEMLTAADWICRCCGQRHRGMFDMAALAPDPWPHTRDYESNSSLRLDGDFLSEDFCVLDGEHFMVRAVLEVPVHGVAENFGYGVWCSLKKENFITYVEGFDRGHDEEAEPWWSWLCNNARPYHDGVESVGGWLHARAGRQRPLFFLEDDDHPLAGAQRDGISPEEVLAIYDCYGHAPQ